MPLGQSKLSELKPEDIRDILSGNNNDKIDIDIDTNTPFSIISIQRKFDELLFDIMEQWKRNKTIPQISIYDDKSKYIELISLLGEV